MPSTSVNRDDQPDGGAHIFARTIEEIRTRVPGCKVEVLIPDFRGDWNALDTVLRAKPDVLNHNTETVPRLYRRVRKGAVYERSLELLRRSKEGHPETPTKTGMMLGLGEEKHEVLSTMQQLARQGTDILTLGQYLQPTREHLPVVRYVHPDEFRSEEHTSELQSRLHLVCRLLLEKKKQQHYRHTQNATGRVLGVDSLTTTLSELNLIRAATTDIFPRLTQTVAKHARW